MKTDVHRYLFDMEDVLAQLFDVVPLSQSVEYRIDGSELVIDFVVPEHEERGSGEGFIDLEKEDDPVEDSPGDTDAGEAENQEEEKSPNLPADEQGDPPDEERPVDAPENAQAATLGPKALEAKEFLGQKLVNFFLDCDQFPDVIETALISKINSKLHEKLAISSLADLDSSRGAWIQFRDVAAEFIAWRDN